MVETGCKILFPWVLLYQLLIVNGIDVTPAYPKKFDTVVITANASELTSVQWVKDSVTLTSCFVGPGICPNPTILPGATIAINTTTVESTITIDSANQTFHGGHYEATGSTAVDVLVNTLPTSVNWTTQPQGNLTSVSSVEWIAKIYCVYPTSEINVHFTVYVEGVKEVVPRSPNLSIEPDSNCDSPEETVVAKLSLSSSNFLNQKIYIIANASHASFPTEPSVTSGQSAEAIFQGPDTTTVGISTTTTDEQSTTSQNPTTSTLDLQTTEATGKTDISTSLSETSTVTVSITKFSVNRGENIGQDHLHLILIIVVSSVCGVIVISVIIVVIFYRYSNKSNKCNRGVESDKKKNYDKNEPKGWKRLKDKHKLSKTKNEYQFFDGRVSQNNHAFEMSETVDTRQNQMTYMTNRRDFDRIVTVPFNSPRNINSSQFHGQTSYPGRKMLAFPQYNYYFSRTLRNQQDGFYLGGHHFNDRRTHSNYDPYALQRSNVKNANYRYDRQLSNTTHSGYFYEKNWLDTTDTIDNKPSFRHGQR